MPIYSFTAMKPDSKIVRDTITADNQSDAISKLREMDLFPTKVRLMSEVGNETMKSQSYLEHLSEFWGNRFIAWGNILKGDK